MHCNVNALNQFIIDPEQGFVKGLFEPGLFMFFGVILFLKRDRVYDMIKVSI